MFFCLQVFKLNTDSASASAKPTSAPVARSAAPPPSVFDPKHDYWHSAPDPSAPSKPRTSPLKSPSTRPHAKKFFEGSLGEQPSEPSPSPGRETIGQPDPSHVEDSQPTELSLAEMPDQDRDRGANAADMNLSPLERRASGSDPTLRVPAAGQVPGSDAERAAGGSGLASGFLGAGSFLFRGREPDPRITADWGLEDVEVTFEYWSEPEGEDLDLDVPSKPLPDAPAVPQPRLAAAGDDPAALRISRSGNTVHLLEAPGAVDRGAETRQIDLLESSAAAPVAAASTGAAAAGDGVIGEGLHGEGVGREWAGGAVSGAGSEGPTGVGLGSGRGLPSGTPIQAMPPASQIDSSVLDALPLGLKRELELAYGKPPPPGYWLDNGDD